MNKKSNNERWYEVYSKNPEIYDLFSKYEDYGNKVLKELLKEVNFEDKYVLDIGCGTGKYIPLIAPLCKRYYALDISKEMLGFAKQKNRNLNNIIYLLADSSKIPLMDDSIDIVFSSWGLSMSVIEGTMREIHRVLRHKGEIWSLGNYPYSEFMFLRGKNSIKRDKKTMEILNSKYGLKVKKVVKTKFVFPSEGLARRILKHIFGEKALRYSKLKSVKELKHNIVMHHKKIKKHN